MNFTEHATLALNGSLSNEYVGRAEASVSPKTQVIVASQPEPTGIS